MIAMSPDTVFRAFWEDIDMDGRRILFEQKMAENTLRMANAEYMADMRRSQGKMLDAKGWDRRAKRLKEQRRELIESSSMVEVSDGLENLEFDI